MQWSKLEPYKIPIVASTSISNVIIAGAALFYTGNPAPPADKPPRAT